MEENRIETMEMENTEIQELDYSVDYDDSEVCESCVGKALLIGGAIVAAGVGLAVTQRKKIRKWLDDRTLAKAEKIRAKRELIEECEEVIIEPVDEEFDDIDDVETE